ARLEGLFALLGELVAFAHEVVQHQAATNLVAGLDADGVRCRNRVYAGGSAGDDDLVLAQGDGRAVRVEHEHLEDVVAGLGQAEFDTCTILQRNAAGRPTGVQAVDLKLDARGRAAAELGDDLGSRFRRARDVVE